MLASTAVNVARRAGKASEVTLSAAVGPAPFPAGVGGRGLLERLRLGPYLPRAARDELGGHDHELGVTLVAVEARTDRVLLSVYVAAGLICAVAAWMLIGRIASASPQAGVSANLDSITAVVIGGTSLFGDRGLVIGALIVGVLRNGLTLTGVDVLWQDFAVGILIIAAVAIDQWIRKVRA